LYQHRLGQALEGLGQNPRRRSRPFDAAFKNRFSRASRSCGTLGRLCYTSNDFDRAQKTFRALLLQKLDGNCGHHQG